MSAVPADPGGSPDRVPPAPGVSAFLNGELLLDVVVPIAAYQLLIHLAGMARLPALVISGAFPRSTSYVVFCVITISTRSA